MKIIRECPICKKQSLHVILDRHGIIISKDCVFCDTENTEEGNG